ncbi:hypothetical protein TNCV_4482711 [Trichonephila clavipes]|nr:hypothetical protein TNCV_4482711 [Trichonephila clavipes]
MGLHIRRPTRGFLLTCQIWDHIRRSTRGVSADLSDMGLHIRRPTRGFLLTKRQIWDYISDVPLVGFC